MSDLVQNSKQLMQEQTKKNKAPALALTEIAIEKGKELAKKHNVDERLVLSSLYLAHTVFSPVWKDEIQKNHTKLSAEFAKKYLDKWEVSQEDQEIILNSIEAHHARVPTKSLVAEVVKNAECFKFVTLKGSLLYFKELGRRGIPDERAVKYVLAKMEQKKKLLTFEDCKKVAEEEFKKIINHFSELVHTS